LRHHEAQTSWLTMPQITVIIPTLRAGPELEKCLSSLGKQTFSDFDVVIVANGVRIRQSDLTFSSSLEHKTRLIVSEENRGYGAACNIGARATSAHFLLFLNDDTFLQPDCLAELYRSLRGSENTIFQPMIHHEYAHQTRAGNPCDIFGAAGLGFYGNCGTGEFYGSGAALAVGRAVYNTLDGFDEKLFLYYDDIDFSWRARLLGFKVSSARNALCLHSGGTSSAGMPHMVKFYLTQRNRIRVLIKNYSMQRVVTRMPIASCLILAGSFFFALKTGVAGYIKYGLEALVWNLVVLRNTLEERHTIQGKRIKSDSEIEKTMCRTSMDICVLKWYLISA
jgi:GT2 family glycosyltransferase